MKNSTKISISVVVAVIIFIATLIISVNFGAVRSSPNVKFLGYFSAQVPQNSSVYLFLRGKTYARIGNIDGQKMYVTIGANTSFIELCKVDCTIYWSSPPYNFKFDPQQDGSVLVTWPYGVMAMN